MLNPCGGRPSPHGALPSRSAWTNRINLTLPPGPDPDDPRTKRRREERAARTMRLVRLLVVRLLVVRLLMPVIRVLLVKGCAGGDITAGVGVAAAEQYQ